jgi:O-antigen/teichoic acid export membrane protein
LLFCALASAALGTVWAALLGSALGPATVFAAFQVFLKYENGTGRKRQVDGDFVEAPKLPALIAILPVALGYGLLMVISNLDILLIYFLLKNQEIGVYSASSVLPKGILVVTMPISQMLFAVMMGDHESAKVFRSVVRKAVWAIGIMTTMASFGVWLFTPWLCGGTFGLKLCAPAPLHLLLLSAVALSLLRIMVLLEFVRQRDWIILSLVAPVSAYLLWAIYSKPEVQLLALEFTIFSIATLTFFIVVRWAAAHWRSAESAP